MTRAEFSDALNVLGAVSRLRGGPKVLKVSLRRLGSAKTPSLQVLCLSDAVSVASSFFFVRGSTVGSACLLLPL